MSRQLAFDKLLSHALRQRHKLVDRYVRANADRYVGFARMMQPDLASWEAVHDRVSFAILSANAPFDDTVRCLAYTAEHRGEVSGWLIAREYRMVPSKADYLNALPRGPELLKLLKRDDETWHAYRMRLTAIKGLGLAKASFTACLLYPLHADLACIDTHMQKLYCGHTGFKTLGLARYLQVEAKVRKVAQRHRLPSTFLAQWMIWDHVRGNVESHAVFPGGHKDVPDWIYE